MRLFIFIFLLVLNAASFARSCGTISNGSRKMTVPCPKRPLSRPVVVAQQPLIAPLGEEKSAAATVTPVATPTPRPVQIAAPSSFSDRQQRIKTNVNQLANYHQMDNALVHAVISVESGYQQSAVSHKGAIGLMQLMPATASYLRVNPHDELSNIDGGIRYLKEQLQRFQRIDLALAAYNAGPQNVIRYGGLPPFSETRAYVRRVMAYHTKYQNDWKEHIQ